MKVQRKVWSTSGPTADSEHGSIEVEIILKYRPGTSGTYIFSGPAASRPYRAPQVIKEVMAIIELKKPEAITWTSLRQQIATISQVYEMIR